MKLTHSSPLGAIEIPGVLGRPKPGELFDVTEEQAARLLEQHELYQAAPYTAYPLDELTALADARGLTHGKKKADVVAALEADDIARAAADPADADTEGDQA